MQSSFHVAVVALKVSGGGGEAVLFVTSRKKSCMFEDSGEKYWRVVTTRLVRDEPSLEKWNRLLEMSIGERLRKNRAGVKIVEKNVNRS